MQAFHVLCAFLLAVIWGLNFIFVQFALNDVSPMMLCVLRFFLASFPAIFFFKPPKTSFFLLMGYAIFIFALQFLFLFAGIKAGVSPGLAGLIVQVQVFFGLFFAVIFLKEQVIIWQIIGAFVAFLGIAMVFAHLGGDVSASGLFLIICASFSWGIGSLLIKKIGSVDAISLVVWGSFIAFIPLLACLIAFEGMDSIYQLRQISFRAIISVLYITYASTWFGYGLWNWLLSRYPMSMLAPFTFLVPIFALFGSVWVFDEVLYPWKISASLMVLSGLCLNLFSRKLATRQEANRFAQ